MIVWSDGPESYAILTSAQFGYKILKIKDRMTKVSTTANEHL